MPNDLVECVYIPYSFVCHTISLSKKFKGKKKTYFIVSKELPHGSFFHLRIILSAGF